VDAREDPGVRPSAVGGGSDGAARPGEVGAAGGGGWADRVSQRPREIAAAGVDERDDRGAAPAGAGPGGALGDGRKQVLAVTPGYRESTESWAAVLRELKARGLAVPQLVIADGHLGIWAALGQVWPEVAEQRCRNHKILNVLDQLPQKVQAAVRLRTSAAKRFKKVANATALIWRLLMVAERRFRKLNAPELLAAVHPASRARSSVCSAVLGRLVVVTMLPCCCGFRSPPRRANPTFARPTQLPDLP